MKTKIIAELCYNHQGSREKAKLMIDEVSKLELWAVKFQKWDIDNFPLEIKNKKRNDKNAFGSTYYEHRKALEFNIHELLQLKEYAEKQGLIFVCSGKDFNSIKLLVENGIKYIKLPSQRFFDNKIFNYLVNIKEEKGLKILVSTGMNHEEENLQSKWIKFADVIMHCISLYPVSKENCDLGILKKYNFFNGYSCHDEKGESIKYAVAMGCKYIERHYTFDKNAKGSDHKLSSDYEEMKHIISEIIEAEKITGDRKLTYEEEQMRLYYRSF